MDTRNNSRNGRIVLCAASSVPQAAEYLRTFFPQDPQTDKALWSQESILQAIQQFLQINGTLPKYYDFYSENGLPSSATVHKIFPGGSITTLYKRYFPEEVQGLHQVKHWAVATIIQSLDEFSKRTRACLKIGDVSSSEGFWAAGKQFFRRNPGGFQGKIALSRGQKPRRLGMLTFFKQALGLV